MSRIRKGALVLAGLGLLIQLVPYGRDHQNPEARQEPAWDQPRTRKLFVRACKDCHSNETVWPAYSLVAPVSWLVQRDVDEGRSHFNVSEWDHAQEHGEEAAQLVRDGEMPPWFYLPAHPEARLSDEERRDLVAGLVGTFGEEHAGSDHEDHEH